MTPAEVNALPERVRRYIHDLETNADPAGMVRANVLLREENAQLRALVGELQRVVDAVEAAPVGEVESFQGRHLRLWFHTIDDEVAADGLMGKTVRIVPIAEAGK